MTLSYLIVQVFEDSNYLFPHVLFQTLPAVCSFPMAAITVHTCVVSYLTFSTYFIHFQISQKRNFLTSL